MATLAGIINYVQEQSMYTAIGILRTLFNAKVDGGTNTNSIYGPKWQPVTSLDDAIKEVLTMMKQDPEFEGLRQKEGHFIRKFREVEAAFEHWDSLGVKPSKDWFLDLPDNYKRDKGKMLLYTEF